MNIKNLIQHISEYKIKLDKQKYNKAFISF